MFNFKKNSKDQRYTLERLLLDESFILWVYDEGDGTWDKWLALNPQQKPIVEEAKAFIFSLNLEKNTLPAVRLAEIRAGIESGILKKEQDRKLGSDPSRIRVWYKIAAIFVLVSIAGTVYFLRHPQLFQLKGNLSETAVKYIEKRAADGQKMAFQLSDGSTIKLNSGSKFIYPEKFEADKREVFLEGEAFLEIQKDSTRPFSVVAGDIRTVVLGTSFNIKAYEDDERIEVALVSGKVSLTNRNFEYNSTEGQVILESNEMAVYHKEKKRTEKSNFDPDKILGWKHKTIYFEDSDFEEVVKTLERWYGVTFIIKSTKELDKGFAGMYTNKPLQTVMEGISFTYGFEYEINDNIVIIK